MVLIIICHHNRDRATPDVSRSTDNQPEKRHDSIIKTLMKTDTPDRSFVKVDSGMPLEMDPDLEKITSSDFIGFLSSAWSSFKGLCNHSSARMYTHLDGGLVPYNFSRGPVNHQLSEYLKVAYYATDTETPIHWSTHRDVITSLHVVRKAIESLTHDTPIAYALTMHPGHHASMNQYGGYCFLNNPVYAAYLMKRRFEFHRVAILDLDYHHGDGSEKLTRDDKNLLTVSIHMDPFLDYPSVSGHAGETENNYNLVLSSHTTHEQYTHCLKKALDKIDRFGADGVVIALGLDTLKGDSDACQPMEILQEDFKRFGYQISSTLFKDPSRKVLITQEGGYKLDLVPKAVDCFLKGFRDGH